MILTSSDLDLTEFARRTGWEIKPEGACRGDVCVPLPDRSLAGIAHRLGMPLVEDPAQQLWCLGPEASPEIHAGGLAPNLRLPLWDGGEFELAALRGTKVLLLAWAPW